MAITGIAINHQQDWPALSKPLPYWLSSSLYNIKDAELIQFKQDGLLLTQTPSHIFLGSKLLDSACLEPITDVLMWQQQLLLLCGNQIEVFDSSGLFLEEIPTLNNRFSALAVCGTRVCVQGDSGWLALDMVTLELNPTDAPAKSSFEKMVNPVYPNELRITPTEFDYGRLVSDLHNGAIFGRIGPVLVDLSGLVILLLGITGCYLWLGNRRRRQKPDIAVDVKAAKNGTRGNGG